jgi:uncharacterized protein YodC (DUF2158 family)
MGMIYFNTGDKVRLKQEVSNRPEMLVESVTKARMPRDQDDKSKSVLLGIKCFWFTTNGFYQEKTFNSKDLEKLEKG